MAILAKVTRGSQVESVHTLSAAVVDEHNDLYYSSGNPDYITCIRSALKPWQAAAGILTGAVDAAGFTEQELALMCASHNGEPVHVETARRMLQKIGFDISTYECGVHLPYHRPSREALIRESKSPSPLQNNCSGKHAGMLCLARHLGVSPRGYTAMDHPVQQKIFQVVKDYTGLTSFPVGIDGCSAPTPFLSLRTIASLFFRLTDDNDGIMRRLYSAMTKHPYLVGGEKRFDTEFMIAMQGEAVTKIGGEAVRGIGIKRKNGTRFGLAIKVLDGSSRPLSLATVQLLQKLNLITGDEGRALDHYQHKILTNHRGLETGDIIIEFSD